MNWIIYRLPTTGGEVTRFFLTLNDAYDFADRNAASPIWTDAIMKSPSGDIISIGNE